MSREAKLLERIRNDPRNVRPDDLFDVLRAEGVTVHRRKASSHVGLSRGATRMTLALPHDGGHLKTPYVVHALKAFGLQDAADVERAAHRAHEHVRLGRTDDGDWLAEVPDLPGCLTHGATRAQALARVGDAQACWLAMGDEA